MGRSIAYAHKGNKPLAEAPQGSAGQDPTSAPRQRYG